jgi:ABC-type lipoprotein release transport system permease subunit
MQAARNGLKSAVRTPGKTLLFVLILTVTAALLTVSCCVFGAVRGYLGNCNDYFRTIAELEYMGQNYPDQAVFDEGCAAALEANRDTISALIASDSVLAWEPASADLMISPLIHRKDNTVPDPDAAILRIRLYNSYDSDSFNGLVTETLYSRKDHTNLLITILTPADGTKLEVGKTYLMAGRFFRNIFQPGKVSVYENDRINDVPAVIPDGSGEEAEAPFRRSAELLHVKNDSCRVTYTAAIEDLYPIHQQVMFLTEGRFFTQAEYDAKAKVCVVSEKAAGLLMLHVGDKIPFTVFHGNGDLYNTANLTETDSGEYEIIGILSHADAYPYWVFLPDAAAANAELRPVNGYSIGQFRLKNGQVSAFLDAAAPLLKQGFRLNVYDQGYAAATEPMEELLFLSVVFLAVCLLLAFCAMSLQSHIFISRQRETARTMYALGSGKKHVCVYFLTAALALTLVGAVLGAVIGILAEDGVFGIMRRFASQYATQDLRFSATRLAVTRTLNFDPVFSAGTYLLAAGILVVGTTAFTLFFTLGAMKKRKNASKKKSAGQRPHKRVARVSRLSGFFKYALLSLRRSRARAGAVLLLGLAAALFFGQLTASLDGYREQLAAYRANAALSGTATDYYGKLISGLNIDPRPIVNLADSDLVKDCCFTTSLGHIKVLKVLEEGEKPSYERFQSAFQFDSTFLEVNRGSVWTGTSSVSHNPLYHYTQEGSVTWLEGYSDADFIQLVEYEKKFNDPFTGKPMIEKYWAGPSICALPRSMMEAQGIRLGDRIDTLVAFTDESADDQLFHLVFTVAASYEAPAGSSAVFCPVTFLRTTYQDETYYLPPDKMGVDEDTRYLIKKNYWTRKELFDAQSIGLSAALNYSGLSFTLTDINRLDELRQVLDEAGFTWVHSGDRTKDFAVIEDEVYLNTTHSMERQIQYVSFLYDALYLLAGVIGFALAWLLVLSRRREIAVMRALGTQPGRIVGNFLLEQLLLMSVGLALGVVVTILTGAALRRAQLLLTAAFLGVWAMSALICLVTGLHKKSFAALTEPE